MYSDLNLKINVKLKITKFFNPWVVILNLNNIFGQKYYKIMLFLTIGSFQKQKYISENTQKKVFFIEKAYDILFKKYAFLKIVHNH